MRFFKSILQGSFGLFPAAISRCFFFLQEFTNSDILSAVLSGVSQEVTFGILEGPTGRIHEGSTERNPGKNKKTPYRNSVPKQYY